MSHPKLCGPIARENLEAADTFVRKILDNHAEATRNEQEARQVWLHNTVNLARCFKFLRENTRPSLVEGVPEGWVLWRVQRTDVLPKYEVAILRDNPSGDDSVVSGTGPTPESAIADAASKVSK